MSNPNRSIPDGSMPIAQDQMCDIFGMGQTIERWGYDSVTTRAPLMMHKGVERLGVDLSTCPDMRLVGVTLLGERQPDGGVYARLDLEKGETMGRPTSKYDGINAVSHFGDEEARVTGIVAVETLVHPAGHGWIKFLQPGVEVTPSTDLPPVDITRVSRIILKKLIRKSEQLREAAQKAAA